MKISLPNYLKYTVYSEDESKEHYLDGGDYPHPNPRNPSIRRLRQKWTLL